MTASGETAVSPAVRVYLSGAVPRGCRSRAQSLTSRTELRRMGRSREALNRLPARLCSRAAGLGPASRRNRLISHSIAGDGLQKLHTLCRPAGKVVRGTESFAGLLKFPGVSGPREGWNPKLKLIRESCLPQPEVAEYPTVVRSTSDFSQRAQPLSRKATNLLHYPFYDLGAV
jgi:hypothetical protein